jgi:hypothetical protein
MFAMEMFDRLKADACHGGRAPCGRERVVVGMAARKPSLCMSSLLSMAKASLDGNLMGMHVAVLHARHFTHRRNCDIVKKPSHNLHSEHFLANLTKTKLLKISSYNFASAAAFLQLQV